ncbi:MAG: phage portal protein, partial [Chloroflexi bacterium]|nr:phage portal protein [Chloroflexota bacterium]
MNTLTKLATQTLAGFKRLTRAQMRHPAHSYIMFDLARPAFDEVRAAIGDGTSSDVLMSVIRWVQRAAVEPRLVALDEDGEPIEESNLQKLIDDPNPFYGIQHLVGATVFDLDTQGNAYWLLAQNGNAAVAEIWWTPATLVEPKWDVGTTGAASEFISHYDYTVGGEVKRLEPSDVIHFRLGVDPQNIRKGLSPLRGIYRELWSDDEAAQFVAALLRHGGVPGLIISPTAPEVQISAETMNATVDAIDSKTTRGGRGRTLGLTGPVKVEQFGFSPQQLDLSVIRDVAEERITAALGVSAAVVGFGSGLQSAKVGATMRELVKLSYHNGVVPLWRIIEDGIAQHLAPLVGGDAVRAEFDLAELEALQEDRDAQADRLERLVSAGIITRAMALTELGFESTDRDDVYLMSV